MINEKTDYLPESLGYDSGQLLAVNDFFEHHINRGVLRGANYAISRGGKTFAAASAGEVSYKNDGRRISLDTIYPICSETKLVTAAGIFKLMELGKLRPTQALSEFIPEFGEPPFSAITIAMLLSHTSGFAVDPGAVTYDRPHHYQLIAQAFERGDSNWIKASLGAGLCFEPGKEWGYSTFGYALLAEVICRVSGTSEKEFITRNILEPCDMTDTCYGIPAGKLDRVLVNDEQQNEEIEAVRKGEAYDGAWADIPDGGSGIYSTTRDLMKLGVMLMNKGMYGGRRVLGKKTVEKLSAVYTERGVLDKCWGNPVGYYRRYGLGPDKRCNEDCLYSPETFFHEGAGRCALIIDPTEKLVAVYLIPYTDPGLWDPDPVWNAHCVIWGGIRADFDATTL